MFQLRFLIGSPRKMSPHIFSHLHYRGQRTAPDDFHPSFNTYVCEPRGTPGTDGFKSSYSVMLELMQHAAQHQAGSQLFPMVELFNPLTRDRVKLAGDEIVLRPADLAAAQAAYEATQPAAPEPTPAPPVNNVNPVNAASFTTAPESSESSESSAETKNSEPKTENAPLTVLERVRAEITANGKATAVQLSNTLGISAPAIKDAVASEGSGLQSKGGWISIIA